MFFYTATSATYDNYVTSWYYVTSIKFPWVIKFEGWFVFFWYAFDLDPFWIANSAKKGARRWKPTGAPGCPPGRAVASDRTSDAALMRADVPFNGRQESELPSGYD